jgi:hypothetical protein
MVKNIALLIVTIGLAAGTRATAAPAITGAEQGGSGVKEIWLHDSKLQELSDLGMLWGFIKYHHAGVTKGGQDMDAALFTVLPLILKTDNKDSVSAIMERWVDGFGKPEPCKQCKPFKASADTKLEPDYGYLFDELHFSKSLRDKLEFIKLNRPATGKSHYVTFDKNISNPQFTNEPEYATDSFPDAGIRLLALYRYWNMIQYFYPNRHLIGEDWNRSLMAMIPDFCNAHNIKEYQLACLKMVTRINDTHAQLSATYDHLNEIKGRYIAPFKAQFIQEKLVVTGYYKDTLGIKEMVKPGDVIEQIDGVSVIDLIRKSLPIEPSSNYDEKLCRMTRSIGSMVRSNRTESSFVLGRRATLMPTTIKRIPVDSTMAASDYNFVPDCGYKILNGNIGFIYPAKLQQGDLEIIKDSFEHTKGLIIDFRCYPKVFMTFDYGQWLKPSSSPFVKFTFGSPDVPGAFNYKNGPENGGGRGKHYQGKVVILVNSRTMSSAEYQTMALQTARGARVIGSQTSGADGNVSEIILPGGLKTRISGIGILYPDGTETQREGVKIDKVVKPTIEGITAGRDELIEAAIKMLND